MDRLAEISHELAAALFTLHQDIGSGYSAGLAFQAAVRDEDERRMNVRNTRSTPGRKAASPHLRVVRLTGRSDTLTEADPFPDQPEQAGRLSPGIRITYRVTHWEAVIPQENGEIIYTRYELRDLLDKLEEL